ncbi:MAG: hypothetical protein M3290_02980, partial [Actinomycetota bacterium]|nr:hypothetical protein [Actinomycetota bacterium]
MVSANPLIRGGTTPFVHSSMTFNWFFSPAWIIAFPLFGAFLLLFFGRRIGDRAGWIASGLLGLSFVWAVIGFAAQLSTTPGDRSSFIHLFDWISVGSFHVGADLAFDQLAAVMTLIVTGVGTLIHVYSIGYMEGDERFSRFFAYLNLFAASMLLLVLAGNVLLLYVGWEGVGLCSYLLIGFWFEKHSAANAAKKAFLVNRIGDFAFLLGIFLLAKTVGTTVIGAINNNAHVTLSGTGRPVLTAGIATIVGFLFLAGATGKSAQIPLYVWLPDAMEGPTPVSALIHAATMVTAGVYLVARF